MRRGRSGASATLDLDRLSEYDAWKHLCDVLAVATSKANTSERGAWQGDGWEGQGIGWSAETPARCDRHPSAASGACGTSSDCC